jgi:transposase-like protein
MERTVSQGASGSNGEQEWGSRKTSPARRCRQAFEQAMKQGDLDFTGYCRLAAQAMLQLAVEEEAAEFIGRASYQRLVGGRTPYRNGYKRRKVLTGEGAIQLAIPQTRNGRKRFQTAILRPFQRRSEMLDALIPQLFVKGLSVRDVSDAFGCVLQDQGISAATASRVAQTIREDFEAWRTRSLALHEVLYLFVDGMYLKLHPDQPEKQPILIAYAILWCGRKVLLHVGLGDRESYDACLGFLRDMAERGLAAPLLYCSDDCPGLRKALQAMWPRSLAQKCQAHKMRNILSKLPRGMQEEFTADPRSVLGPQLRRRPGQRPGAHRAFPPPLPAGHGVSGQESRGMSDLLEGALSSSHARTHHQLIGAAHRRRSSPNEGHGSHGW